MAYTALDANQIGGTLKGLREKRGETMEELSNAINVSPSAIAMYESGRRIPRDEIKIKIAEHFSRTVESIFYQKKQHDSCSA